MRARHWRNGRGYPLPPRYLPLRSSWARGGGQILLAYFLMPWNLL